MTTCQIWPGIILGCNSKKGQGTLPTGLWNMQHIDTSLALIGSAAFLLLQVYNVGIEQDIDSLMLP